MADTKITGFTADLTPAAADLVVTAKSPFGAGSNRKVTLADIQSYVLTIDSANLTLSTTTSGNIVLNTATAADLVDINGLIDHDVAVIDSATAGIIDSRLALTTTEAKDSQYRAFLGSATYSSLNNLTNSFALGGGFYTVVNSGAGTVTGSTGFITQVANTGAGTTTLGRGISVQHAVTAGAMTDFVGVVFEDPAGIGATNVYAFDFNGADYVSNGTAVIVRDDTVTRYMPLSAAAGGITLASALTMATSDVGASANDAGASVSIASGDGGSLTTGGAGGFINIAAGDAAGSGNNNGGSLSIAGGNATGSGTSGGVALKATAADIGSSEVPITAIVDYAPTANNANGVTGFYGFAKLTTAFNLTSSISVGVSGSFDNQSTGTVTAATAFDSTIVNSVAGTITDGALYSGQIQEVGGTITNAIGFNMANHVGTPTNTYLFKLPSSSSWLSNSRAFPVLDNATTRYIMMSDSDTGLTLAAQTITFATTTSGNIQINPADNLGFFGTSPAAQAAAYTRNATAVEDRTLLASASATTINNNNVLAALIADLQAYGLIQ